jgi:hypothetical protein
MMKLSSLVVAGMLVAASVVISAPQTKADGLTDPNITIGKGFGSIPTTAGGTDQNPIIVTDDSSPTFCYGDDVDGVCSQDETNPLPALSALYVEVIPFDGESTAFFQSEGFTCTPGDGATGCFTASPTQLPGVEFVFFAQDANGDPVPFITGGSDISVFAPEPAPLAMLLIGIGAVVAFGLKRRQSPLAS